MSHTYSVKISATILGKVDPKSTALTTFTSLKKHIFMKALIDYRLLYAGGQLPSGL